LHHHDSATRPASKAADQKEPKTVTNSSVAGKYMTFMLANQEYGIEILTVRDVIGLMEITAGPKTLPYIRGIINLRGRVIPVVDLRMKFDMRRTESKDQTVIIVVECGQERRKLTMGVLVDEVLEVLDIHQGSIEPRPDFGDGTADMSFITGVGKTGEWIIILVQMENVLCVPTGPWVTSFW
jgi:purine-binding chemotaxis protein CheW